MYKISLVLFIFMLYCHNSIVFAKNYLIVKEIKINETAANSLIAKNKGIALSKRQAFNEIIKAFKPNISNKSLEKITNKEIQNAIMSFSILSENITKNSYRATLEYVFDQNTLYDLVKKTLKNSEKKTILVIPILKKDNELLIWENDWFYSWANNAKKEIKIIEEDIRSLSNITLKNLDEYNKGMEENLRKKYTVDEVFLIQLEIASAEEIIITFLNNTIKNVKKINYAKDDFFITATKEEIFNSLVKHCLMYIENAYLKFNNTIKTIEESHTKHNILIKNPSDWKFISKNALKNIEYNMKYISNDMLIIEIKWNGDLESLYNHFASNKKISVFLNDDVLEIEKTN